MPTSRANLAMTLPAMVGGGVLGISDAGTGWPAKGQITTTLGTVEIDLFVGPVGLSQRERDDVERRFQNPGASKPILLSPGRVPLLLGVWTEGGHNVLVGMDALTRADRRTRFSMFMPLHLLQRASATGWAEHHSTSAERLIAFRPSLLPIYVDLIRSGVDVDQMLLQAVLEAAGGGDESDDQNAMARGRRIASQLVRDAVFSKKVRDSYNGFCAMCGLDYSLIVGAHIYPVAAGSSRDETWNGLALCHNHHAAFDSHRIFVDPSSKRIRLHRELVEGRTKSEACRTFVDMTFEVLRQPVHHANHPRASMFERRYEYFNPKYGWAI